MNNGRPYGGPYGRPYERPYGRPWRRPYGHPWRRPHGLSYAVSTQITRMLRGLAKRRAIDKTTSDYCISAKELCCGLLMVIIIWEYLICWHQQLGSDQKSERFLERCRIVEFPTMLVSPLVSSPVSPPVSLLVSPRVIILL